MKADDDKQYRNRYSRCKAQRDKRSALPAFLLGAVREYAFPAAPARRGALCCCFHVALTRFLLSIVTTALRIIMNTNSAMPVANSAA